MRSLSSICSWISLVSWNFIFAFCCLIWLIICGWSGNKIGSEGGKVLAEALKVNATLTQLSLYSIYSFYGWIYVFILWFDLADNLYHVQTTALAQREVRFWLKL